MAPILNSSAKIQALPKSKKYLNPIEMTSV